VLSRNLSIERRRRVLVAPCTTTLRGLTTEVELDPRVDPVAQACAVNMDSLESLSIALLIDRIGTLSVQRMRQLCAALAIAVDC
jgi:mRNA interferase MazF